MSRGPGRLQRKIEAALSAAGGGMPFDRLAERFPREAGSHSLHRALRKMIERGLVVKQDLPSPRPRGTRRWVYLTWEGDSRLRALVGESFRQLRMVAQARGLYPNEIERQVMEDAERERHGSEKR